MDSAPKYLIPHIYIRSDFNSATNEGSLIFKNLKNSMLRLFAKKAIGQQFPEGIKGSVLIDRGEVTGDFRELLFTLSYPSFLLRVEEFTAEMHAAIILHELGHAFTTLEYLDQTVLTNQVLLTLLCDLTKVKDEKEKEFLIAQNFKQLNIRQDPEEYVNDTHKLITVVLEERSVILNKTIQERYAYIGGTASEQLADQFATRFGAGAALVSGMFVMNKLYGYTVDKTTDLQFKLLEVIRVVKWITYSLLQLMPVYHLADVVANLLYIHKVTKTLRMPFSLVNFALKINAPLLISGFLCVCFISKLAGGCLKDTLYLEASVNPNGRYDIFRNRIKRIREDLVNQLKAVPMGSLESKDILVEIKEIDGYLKDLQNKDSWLVRFILGSAWVNQLNQSRQLEELAANDLFVQAHEFKHLLK